MTEAEKDKVIDEITRYNSMIEKERDSERLKRMQFENQASEQSAFANFKDPNLAEYQIDLDKELERLYHLLSGHIIGVNAEGNQDWFENPDDRQRIFSEYGVKQIMNLISFYINKNTLLSMYDEETINWIVKDFGIALVDLIYARMEMFFYYPMPEELYEKYKDIVRAKKLNISDEELYYKCVQWSEEELDGKAMHFESIILAVIHSVYTTYRRALKGEERDSLRKFMHISQIANNQMPQMQSSTSTNKSKWYNPTTWGG